MLPHTARATIRVGIIADTQYVDAEDGATFDKKTTRRYRHSLAILKRAVPYFVGEGVRSAVHLGDLLDSKCKDLDNDALEYLFNISSLSSISFILIINDFAEISDEIIPYRLSPIISLGP